MCLKSQGWLADATYFCSGLLIEAWKITKGEYIPLLLRKTLRLTPVFSLVVTNVRIRPAPNSFIGYSLQFEGTFIPTRKDEGFSASLIDTVYFLFIFIYISCPFTKQINANLQRMRKRPKSTTLWLSGLCPISLSHCWALIPSIPVSISTPSPVKLFDVVTYTDAPLCPFTPSALRVSIILRNNPYFARKGKKRKVKVTDVRFF